MSLLGKTSARNSHRNGFFVSRHLIGVFVTRRTLIHSKGSIQRSIQNPDKHLRFDEKKDSVNYFFRKLHLRCFTGFSTRLCLGNL